MKRVLLERPAADINIAELIGGTRLDNGAYDTLVAVQGGLL